MILAGFTATLGSHRPPKKPCTAPNHKGYLDGKRGWVVLLEHVQSTSILLRCCDVIYPL